MRFPRFFVSLVLAVTCCALSGAIVVAQTPEPTAEPQYDATLMSDNSAQSLLAGELLSTVTISDVQAELEAFPPDWPVVGVGSTDWNGRHGEMLPAGTAGDLHFWWADPLGSPSGDIWDLAGSPARLPFVALAVGNPETARTWRMRDVEDVHGWLEKKLEQNGIDIAGVQVVGEFSQVDTSVVYNIPLTGLDLSGGYKGDDFFHFGHYLTGTWTIVGLYAIAPDMQPVISTPGHPLHLHGYLMPDMEGGHVGSARAISATVTVWPLVSTDIDQVGFLEGLSPTDDLPLGASQTE